MVDAVPVELKRILAEKLAGSLTDPLPTSTARKVFGSTGLPGKVTAVVGMRRAGKTTFLHQLRQQRLEQGAPREALPYVNFEDERLADLQGSQLGFLVEEYNRCFPDASERGTVTWYFDEIQVRAHGPKIWLPGK